MPEWYESGSRVKSDKTFVKQLDETSKQLKISFSRVVKMKCLTTFSRRIHKVTNAEDFLFWVVKLTQNWRFFYIFYYIVVQPVLDV